MIVIIHYPMSVGSDDIINVGNIDTSHKCDSKSNN